MSQMEQAPREGKPLLPTDLVRRNIFGMVNLVEVPLIVEAMKSGAIDIDDLTAYQYSKIDFIDQKARDLVAVGQNAGTLELGVYFQEFGEYLNQGLKKADPSKVKDNLRAVHAFDKIHKNIERPRIPIDLHFSL